MHHYVGNNPFMPHKNMDGKTFATTLDPALDNTTHPFTGYAQWSPSDHRGCECEYVLSSREPETVTPHRYRMCT